MKQFLQLLVTSAAYRQSSRVTPELLRARPGQPPAGPRAAVPPAAPRRSATRRWPSAACSARKMYGPPVKPPQPATRPQRRLRRRHRLADQRRRGPLSPRPLHDLAAHRTPTRRWPPSTRPNREVCTVRRTAHQHAAAGAGHAQRSGLRRSGPGARPRMAGSRRGRGDACRTTADEGPIRLPPLLWPVARRRGAANGSSSCTRRPATEFYGRTRPDAVAVGDRPARAGAAGGGPRRPRRLDRRRAMCC